MANILCLYENIIATVAGTLKFLKELAEYDSRVAVKSVSISKLNTSDIAWCDVLYMIRPNNECFARIAKTVRKIGITVVYFLDDDLLNLPKGKNILYSLAVLILNLKDSDTEYRSKTKMEKFLEFVANIMEEDKVTMDLPFKEGKWDSLMMLTLVMELEAEYGVSIPIEKLGDVKTLANMYNFVK